MFSMETLHCTIIKFVDVMILWITKSNNSNLALSVWNIFVSTLPRKKSISDAIQKDNSSLLY